MVEVEISRENGHIRGYGTKGHADYGEPGKNIVCAGISALEDGMNCALIEYDVQYIEYETLGGERNVIIQNPTDITDSIISVFITGCKRIQEAYPQCIKVHDQDMKS